MGLIDCCTENIVAISAEEVDILFKPSLVGGNEAANRD